MAALRRRPACDIAGATNATYVLVKADEGATIKVVVTAVNATGSGTATSAPTGVVAAAPPVNTHRPVIAASGPIAQGVTLTDTAFTWTATADTSYAFSWERCDTNGCAPIAGATLSQYVLVAADVGKSIVAVSIATNPDGTVTARSDQTSVAALSAPRWKTLPILSSAPGKVGDLLNITRGQWTGPIVVTDTTQMMRCTNVCAATGTSNATAYTIASGDVGAILRLRETASNAGGDTVVWSTRYVGPVINAQSAAAVVKNGKTALKNSEGDTLAVATLPKAGASASKVSKPKTKPAVTVKRAADVSGKVTAWACEATMGTTSAPQCSKKVTLKGSATTLSLPASAKGRVRVVVVKGK